MKGLDEKNLRTVILALDYAIDKCDYDIAGANDMKEANKLIKLKKEFKKLYNGLIL